MTAPTTITSGTTLQRQLGKVARGGVLGLVGAVVAGAAGFGVVLFVARGYPTAQAGLFFSATAVFLVLVAVSTLGTEAGFARLLKRYEAQDRPEAIRLAVYAGCVPALGVSLLLAGLGGAFAQSWGHLLGFGDSGANLLMLLSLALPFAVCADLALSVMRAFGEIRTTVVVDRVLRSGAQLGAAILVVMADGSVLVLVVCWSAAYVVSTAVAVPLALRFLARRLSVRLLGPLRGGRSVARELWAFTGYRGVARVAQIAIQKADIVIVAAVVSPTAAALYTAATRFVALGQIVTGALQQVVQPRYSAILLRGDHDLLSGVHRTVTAWNVLAVWPIYLIVGAAPAAYLAIFGELYAAQHTWLVVTVMSVAMLGSVATGPVDTLLLMSGRSGLSLVNTVLALLLDVALCLALLPVLGLVGAAVAWAVAVTTRCGLAVRQVRRELAVPVVGREAALAGLVAVLCFATPSAAWSLVGGGRLDSWLALTLLGTGAYAVLLWRLRRVLHLDLLVNALRRTRAPGERLPGWRRITRAARRSLPGPAVIGLRRVALGWGMATAGLRMPPSFVVAGAQRCGTTSLFRMLAAHPNLVRPTLDKGTGYFDDQHERGPRWYRAHFPLRFVARWRKRGNGTIATFECSGYYMFHPLAPERIAAELPDARVVVMLRNPVDRAVSAHGHERARGFETRSFVEALVAEPDRLAGEIQHLAADEHYRSFAHRHHAYLARGEYAGQVLALINALGRDRVYVIDADAFFADPEGEFSALQMWLGLPVWIPDRVERWNTGTPEPMPAAWRRRLEQHFEPHDQALAAVIGRNLTWLRKESTS